MADHTAIRDLLHQSDILHAEHLPHTSRAPETPRFSRDFLRDALDDERTAILVATEDEQVVAFVLLEEEHPSGPDEAPEPWCAIYDVAVRRDRWGRGIGAALLAAAEQWAQRRGLGQMRLDVYEFNTRARALYERLGYTTHSRELIKTIAPSSAHPT
jgi:ribosomal protein S18 acetylase RimI-like enzyme